MAAATQIIFRRLTESDFFNINSPGLSSGGGQSYIDVSTANVSRKNWSGFFAPAKSKLGAQDRPYWDVTIHSIGVPGNSQIVSIGERRDASFNIRSQKLFSNESNRVAAWRPGYGFPAPAAPFGSRQDPALPLMMANLTVYLVRDDKGDIWAGWHNRAAPPAAWKVAPPLTRLFDAKEQDGIILFGQPVPFDPTNAAWPFGIGASAYPQNKKDDDVLNELFADDVGPEDKNVTYKLQQVRKRNTKAVGPLKKLYNWRCQITGEEFAFETAGGKRYVEAHHLVPLGAGGADTPENLVIVSAHIHKMLHYAEISEIDLKKIKDNKLPITIGGKDFTITWNDQHGAKVLAAAKDA